MWAVQMPRGQARALAAKAWSALQALRVLPVGPRLQAPRVLPVRAARAPEVQRALALAPPELALVLGARGLALQGLWARLRRPRRKRVPQSAPPPIRHLLISACLTICLSCFPP